MTTPEIKAPKIRPQSMARYFAIQALFQMEQTDQSSDAVIDEFEAYRFNEDLEEGKLASTDARLFRLIINTAVERQAKIDQITHKAMDDDWPIDRIDTTLRAILRAAAAETLSAATPPKVIINEYLELTRAFFDDRKMVQFVNAVLDKTVKTLRD